MERPEFETLEELNLHLATHKDLVGCVFQSLDLRGHTDILLSHDVSDAVFLGCRFRTAALDSIHATSALVFPSLPDLPFNAYRGSLYTVEELFAGYQPGQPESYDETLDAQIYRHFVKAGGADTTSILENLARRLHDHAISDAVSENIQDRKTVAIMGGHSMTRDSHHFWTVAWIARELTRRGFLVVSGGGPGAMEATHLGAWFAARSESEMRSAVGTLSRVPRHQPVAEWLDCAFEVRARYPLVAGGETEVVSLGIPTWHYGNEPTNLFATHIAKYFANSIREEGLLAIGKYGIVFAPGGAGTVQEIFQDAAQNHYRSFGPPSPMVFIGEGFWKWTKPVYPLLCQLAAGREYAKLLSITEDPAEAVDTIVAYVRP